MKLSPTKGYLLIAEPSIIGDVSFNRSVVLLADHNDNGTVGFIMNKPLEQKLQDFIPILTTSDIPVFNGGPVEQDNIYFIHTVPHLIKGSTEIASGIFWGGDFETAIHLIEDKKIKPKEVQFFLGYSGWDSQQLNQELQEKSWVVVENNYKEDIITKCCPMLWREKIIELGGDYLIWSNAPEHPHYN
ncbi:YqgE/AlgH family protein [Dokdonia sp.]|uniref:YqgE/AlgH family protein n=1 Tax=Dokdonia sp. TaxID=2024995 RepID=UPI003264B34E